MSDIPTFWVRAPGQPIPCRRQGCFDTATDFDTLLCDRHRYLRADASPAPGVATGGVDVVAAPKAPWSAEAACKGRTSLFYAERGYDAVQAVPMAKALCHGCPTQRECLEAGMSERFGVWGGYTSDERRRLRRRRQEAA